MQVLNILALLNPDNFKYLDAPYCSTVFIELHYDDACMLLYPREECFYVKTIANGTELTFDGCKDDLGKP